MGEASPKSATKFFCSYCKGSRQSGAGAQRLHSDALPQLRERAGYGKSYERPWRIYLPHPTFTPDAPAHLEALILKAVSKTTDDKGRRYVTIQPDTCLPANTTTIAKLKAVIGEFLRWHYDRRNVLAGLSLLLGYFEHVDSKGGATTFDVDTEENAQVVRGLAHLGVRYIPDAESDAREPHRKARVVQAWFPVGLLIIASAVDTAHAGEDCQHQRRQLLPNSSIASSPSTACRPQAFAACFSRSSWVRPWRVPSTCRAP